MNKPAVEVHELFRQAALEARSRSLNGSVVVQHGRQVRFWGWAIALIALVGGAFILVTSFSSVMSARGTIVPATPAAEIIPLRPGLITSLNVSLGQDVGRGQQLVQVDTSQISESGQDLSKDQLATLRSQIQLARSQRDATSLAASAEYSRLEAQAQGLLQQISLLSGQASIQKDRIESAQSLLAKLETIRSKGFVSEFEFDRRRQSLLEAIQANQRLEQQKAEAQSQLTQVRAQLRGLTADRVRADVQIQSAIGELDRQRLEVDKQRAYLLRSPFDGKVSTLDAAPGVHVTPDKPIMRILPRSAAMRVEVFVPTKAAGKLELGMPVRMQIDGYPYAVHGTLDGVVRSMALDAIKPSETPEPLPPEDRYYRVVIEFPQPATTSTGEKVRLNPGMKLTALFVADRKTIFEWLMESFTSIKRSRGE